MEGGDAYWVDWVDPPNPQIRPWRNGDDEQPISLAAAKKKIVDRAKQERKHWLRVIHQTESLTPDKVAQLDHEAENG